MPLDIHSDRSESLPLLEMPGLLRGLIDMDKQAEGKKSQQPVPGRIRGQPPAKQTPGQQRDKHANQLVCNLISNAIRCIVTFPGLELHILDEVHMSVPDSTCISEIFIAYCACSITRDIMYLLYSKEAESTGTVISYGLNMASMMFLDV